MKTAELKIDGMHCAGCVNRVTQALQKAGTTPQGVQVGGARVQYEESRLSPETIVQALDKIGFAARIADGNKHDGGV